MRVNSLWQVGLGVTIVALLGMLFLPASQRSQVPVVASRRDEDACVDVFKEYLKEKATAQELQNLQFSTGMALTLYIENQRSGKIVNDILSAMVSSKNGTLEELTSYWVERGPSHFAQYHLATMQHDPQKCLGLDTLEETRECELSNRKTLEENPFFDGPLQKAIENEISPESVLDFGSGTGHYSAAFFRSGVSKCVGVEVAELGPMGYYAKGWDISMGPVQVPIFLPDEKIALDALRCAVMKNKDETFDMVFSAEVMEHIPREKHCAIMNYLTRQARKYIVVSIATLWQNGLGHIANRMKEDFINDWRKRGLVLDDYLTAKLQEGASIEWLKRNILVFRVPQDRSLLVDVDCSSEKWLPYVNFDEDKVYIGNGETLTSSEWNEDPGLQSCYETFLEDCCYKNGRLCEKS